MKLEDKIRSDIRNRTLKRLASTLQSVTKKRIEQVLKSLSRGTADQVDAVFALLDNKTPNWFTEAAVKGFKFCEGASTAHLACHIGILQRDAGKLDREGRDYWLKPLWEIGALEKVTFDSEKSQFLDGHPVAKSPNSAYRIATSFLDVLKGTKEAWPKLLTEWSSEDATRARLQIQAKLAESAKTGVGSAHEKLIAAACRDYATRFLPGFEVLYLDLGDGDRVDEDAKKRLKDAGLGIELGDSMPDVLLWNKETDALWVIEAVCSDGEVDLHKIANLRKLAERHGKFHIGFTTAYPTWQLAATRQGKHKNIPPGTFIWIQEDGTKQFSVETFKA
jgi:hypothetical protein